MLVALAGVMNFKKNISSCVNCVRKFSELPKVITPMANGACNCYVPKNSALLGVIRSVGFLNFHIRHTLPIFFPVHLLSLHSAHWFPAHTEQQWGKGRCVLFPQSSWGDAETRWQQTAIPYRSPLVTPTTSWLLLP